MAIGGNRLEVMAGDVVFHRAFIDLSALDLVNPEDIVLSAP
jgi:hypothetical protein